MMATEISSSDDRIDVRDVIARYEELEGERETLAGTLIEESESANADLINAAEINLAEWDEENGEELKLLGELLKELAGCGGDEQWRGDWYPIGLIRDSDFESAMDELLEDIGDLPKDLPCYLRIEVDYKALQMDYSSVEFDGVTYWYR